MATNFTNPVTYTVTAADASTQDYTVTVTVAAAAIGQSYGGGRIAYILQSGDPGYVAGQTHGLIAATVDQSDPDYGTKWWNEVYTDTGALDTALGTGLANTDKIITSQGGTPTDYAAGLARAYAGGGYTDWYLPSLDELNKLNINHEVLNFTYHWAYWSSSEAATNYAWYRVIGGGSGNQGKETKLMVRAVRSF